MAVRTTTRCVIVRRVPLFGSDVPHSYRASRPRVIDARTDVADLIGRANATFPGLKAVFRRAPRLFPRAFDSRPTCAGHFPTGPQRSPHRRTTLTPPVQDACTPASDARPRSRARLPTASRRRPATRDALPVAAATLPGLSATRSATAATLPIPTPTFPFPAAPRSDGPARLPASSPPHDDREAMFPRPRSIARAERPGRALSPPKRFTITPACRRCARPRPDPSPAGENRQRLCN
jgi:hypothetical protein